MGTRATGTIAQRWLRCGLVAALLLTAGALVHPATTVRAATDTVTTCAATGPGSLPAVLAAAAAGDTITFAQDCTDATAIALTATLAPTQNITINAAAPLHTVTIDGGGKVQLFYVGSGVALSLRGLTLANGNSDTSGGAILTYGTVNITGCTFAGNGAAFNGGVMYSVGTVNVRNSVFSHNTANVGGAIINNGGTLNVTGSTFAANSARTSSGGAIQNFDGTASVAGSTFSDNVASHGGGALSNGDTLNVTNSIFSGNSATGNDYAGGAIVNGTDSTLNVTGSTFSGNTAPISGGAIANSGLANLAGSTFSGNAVTANSASLGGALYNASTGTSNVSGSAFISNSSMYSGGAIANSGTLNVVNSTFSGNAASGDLVAGGALSNGYNGKANVVGSSFSGNAASNDVGGALANLSGTLRLTLSVVAGNSARFTGPDIVGTVTTDSGGNVIGDTTGSIGLNPLRNTLNVDPLLAPLADNGGRVQTFALMPGSPASGIAPCPMDPITMMPLATDARGVARPQGASGKCDAGSYQGA